MGFGADFGGVYIICGYLRIFERFGLVLYEELRKRFIERSKIQQKIAMADIPTSDDLQNWIRARNNIVLAKF